MLMGWFGEQTTEWIADECARAGLTMTAPEAEVGSATAPGLPREEPGPREQEPQSQPQAVSRPRWTYAYHECAAEGCDTLVCNGGERQHMQSPYCSDACWHEHEKDGRVHGPADTRAWAEDTHDQQCCPVEARAPDRGGRRSSGRRHTASGHQSRRSPVGPLSREEARAGGDALPRPEGSVKQAGSPLVDVIASVPWTRLTSSTSDLGDGGASTDAQLKGLFF
jgi:hypothetical protein